MQKAARYCVNKNSKKRETVGVRVDYLQNGEIIPILIMGMEGSFERIDRIISSCQEKSCKENNERLKYYCIVREKVINLYYENHIWYKDI